MREKLMREKLMRYWVEKSDERGRYDDRFEYMNVLLIDCLTR